MEQKRLDGTNGKITHSLGENVRSLSRTSALELQDMRQEGMTNREIAAKIGWTIDDVDALLGKTPRYIILKMRGPNPGVLEAEEAIANGMPVNEAIGKFRFEGLLQLTIAIRNYGRMPMPTKKEMDAFFYLLKGSRQNYGITQKDILKTLGLAPNAITVWASGRAKPLPCYFPAIARVLGISVDVLLGREDKKAAEKETERAEKRPRKKRTEALAADQPHEVEPVQEAPAVKALTITKQLTLHAEGIFGTYSYNGELFEMTIRAMKYTPEQLFAMGEELMKVAETIL